MKYSYKIFLSYSESSSGGGICAGQENNSFPDREDEHIEFTPLGLYYTKGDSQETIDINFDPTIKKDEVYMVVVRYYDGDTFGVTYGLWSIEGVFESQKEAENIKKSIENKTYESPKGYNVWDGYFAGLESVNIWETVIKKGSCAGIMRF